MSKSRPRHHLKPVPASSAVSVDPATLCSQEIQASLTKHGCVIFPEPYFIPAEAGGFRVGARIRIGKKQEGQPG